MFIVRTIVISALIFLVLTPIISVATYQDTPTYDYEGEYLYIAFKMRRTYKIRAESIYDPVDIKVYIATMIVDKDYPETTSIKFPGITLFVYSPKAPVDDIWLDLGSYQFYSNKPKFNYENYILDQILLYACEFISNMYLYGAIPCEQILELTKEDVPQSTIIEEYYGQLYISVAAGSEKYYDYYGFQGGLSLSYSTQLLQNGDPEHFYGWYSYKVYISGSIEGAGIYTDTMVKDITYGTCVFQNDPDECRLTDGVPGCPNCPIATGYPDS